MSSSYSNAVETAREYYNSEDADNFYSIIWGGEDIHIGLYKDDVEPIADASRRTVQRMAERIKNLNADSRVLDLGAGYGGAARYLAQTYGCKVTALNLSEKENERDRELNREHKLDHLIDVVDASFESVPAEDGAFDVVWSQDAFLHSGQRETVINEIARVLSSGGELIFTDPMQADDCPEGVLQPVLDRIHLDTLGSVAFYREMAAKYGMRELHVEPMTEYLVKHYSRVREELSKAEHNLQGKVSPDYIERMHKGLGHWVEAGNNGYLTWGILHFQKT